MRNRFWLVALVAWTFPAAAVAAQLALAWDAPPSTAVTGYYVYVGTGSRSYSTRIGVGAVTTATVPNLVAGQRYYFAVTARDSADRESVPSNEVTAIASGATASTTTLTVTPSPSITAGTVTMTATVTGTLPTGTVAFIDGTTAVAGCGGVALTGTGSTRTASCTTAALAAGSHALVASYGGDGNHSPSTSGTWTQSVLWPTTTTISSSSNPAAAGASVTFTATVSGSVTTGGVGFRIGTAAIAGCASVALAGTGATKTATCTTNLAAGSYGITASYSGSSTHAVSTSAVLTQVAQAAQANLPPAATLTAPLQGASYAYPAVLSLAAAASDPDGSVARVEFFAGSTALGSDTAAPFSLSWNPPAGVHTLTARATDNAGAVTVSPAVVVSVVGIDLASSANPARRGEAITLTATVVGNAPTGTVRFRADGAVVSACSAVALAGTGNTRTAACALAALPEGVHALGADYSGNAANAAVSSAPLSQIVSSQQVWVDDAIPAGARWGGDEPWTWTSSSPAPYAGVVAHPSSIAAGLHQHWFESATQTLTVPVGHALFAYVYLDPASPPSQIMLQWSDGTWEHRAYWGANLIAKGVDGTASRRSMGPLPAVGQWVRLEVPAALVGLEGRTLNGMSFTLYGGRATWDYAGSAPMDFDDIAWVDDAIPAGARWGGEDPWTWTTAGPAPFAGAYAHPSTLAAGLHQQWFESATQTLTVPVGSSLFTYVYLDPANPPSQVMLQWSDGTWEHRAYWGANLIAKGVDGTASRRYVGPLPATGRWVRLAVPASLVGLEGKTLHGMSFTLYDGRATWDYAGASRSP